MRRFVPLCLLGSSLLLGCQSLEDRACENTVRVNLAAAAEAGRTETRSESQLQRNCMDSLMRLRQEIQPDEEAWFTYMRCVREAPDMAAQGTCLEPLTKLQNTANGQ